LSIKAAAVTPAAFFFGWRGVRLGWRGRG